MLTDSKILVPGRPGKGKSTAEKTFQYREHGVNRQRRFIAINDPKGEYGTLGERLGMPVIKLHPGGQHRLNPLDPAPGDRDDKGLLGRQRLVTGMLAVVLERRLEPAEESLVSGSIAHLAGLGERFDLGDLARIVGDPPAELLAHAEFGRLTDVELRAAVMPVRFALGKLLDRTLRGMFDGPTKVSVDWETGPGVVIDLSAVFQDREALPLVMMAATSWLQSAMTALAPGRRGLQVDDEVWALLENEWTVRHLQARLKLCRHWGICNILVCHRLSDLRAQSADGTAAHKVAAGLLGDTGTRIFFQQAPDQVSDAQELLGLTDVEAQLLPRLVRGRALWRVGERSAVVQHVLSPREAGFCDTDQAMSA
ncbi:MAG: ATP-binding protein [Aeromicrobium sp.]|nr:ATP-binding protein [Aeromicrobium sp.]